MKTFIDVGAVMGLVVVETLVAALILMPGTVLRRSRRTLHTALEPALAAARKARDRLRGFMRPRGPRFRPPRFA